MYVSKNFFFAEAHSFCLVSHSRLSRFYSTVQHRGSQSFLVHALLPSGLVLKSLLVGTKLVPINCSTLLFGMPPAIAWRTTGGTPTMGWEPLVQHIQQS